MYKAESNFFSILALNHKIITKSLKLSLTVKKKKICAHLPNAAPSDGTDVLINDWVRRWGRERHTTPQLFIWRQRRCVADWTRAAAPVIKRKHSPTSILSQKRTTEPQIYTSKFSQWTIFFSV